MKRKNNKKLSENLTILGISATTFIAVYSAASILFPNVVTVNTKVPKYDVYENAVVEHYKSLISGEDLIPDSTDNTVMMNNTNSLQRAIDNMSSHGGGIVMLPSGTFYFSYGGISKNGELYAIKVKDNVHIIGAGTDSNDTNKLTILKPVHDNTGNTGSIDMFYFNNYTDSIGEYDYPFIGQKRKITYTNTAGKNIILNNQNVFLTNADFSNFVIDGEKTIGGAYDTSGKGFAFKLFKDCDWNNVVVKNTDATGFGVDFPINSTIKNSVAINCGKSANTAMGGASGFGIGTGVMDNESIIISNCLSLNNKKYGFFFEHQSRFSDDDCKATKSLGFVVKDSIAGGNLYDFGGLKANNVTYQNVESISGSNKYQYNGNYISINSSKAPANFSLYSVNNQFINSNLSKYAINLGYNEDNVRWAIDNGYISLDDYSNFNSTRSITREEAIKILYRYNKMSGNVNIMRTINQQRYTSELIKTTAGFTDITIPNYLLENDNLDAILWGVDKKILSHDIKFRGSDNCTRAEFFTMLYRLAGSPNVGTVSMPFEDVTTNSWYTIPVMWAYANKITVGKGSIETFKPNDAITKNEVAIALYRYNNSSFSVSNNVKDNLSNITNSEPKIESVSINSYPTKLNYRIGEHVNISGLSLKVTYSDGSINYIIPEFNNSSELRSKGNKIIKFSYQGFNIEFRIAVY